MVCVCFFHCCVCVWFWLTVCVCMCVDLTTEFQASARPSRETASARARESRHSLQCPDSTLSILFVSTPVPCQTRASLSVSLGYLSRHAYRGGPLQA